MEVESRCELKPPSFCLWRPDSILLPVGYIDRDFYEDWNNREQTRFSSSKHSTFSYTMWHEKCSLSVYLLKGECSSNGSLNEWTYSQYHPLVENMSLRILVMWVASSVVNSPVIETCRYICALACHALLLLISIIIAYDQMCVVFFNLSYVTSIVVVKTPWIISTGFSTLCIQIQSSNRVDMTESLLLIFCYVCRIVTRS